MPIDGGVLAGRNAPPGRSRERGSRGVTARHPPEPGAGVRRRRRAPPPGPPHEVGRIAAAGAPDRARGRSSDEEGRTPMRRTSERRHAGAVDTREAEEARVGAPVDGDALEASIRHDYSTSDNGIVPLDQRRPAWHFASLWLTLASGFSFLFLGLELYRERPVARRDDADRRASGAASSSPTRVFSAYLGSRTGQTHALLTRSIFGVAGSWLVSFFVLIAPLGWVAFQANLLVEIWDGLYGWGNVVALTVLMAGAMVINSLFGFTGIAVFARYVVTPLTRGLGDLPRAEGARRRRRQARTAPRP